MRLSGSILIISLLLFSAIFQGCSKEDYTPWLTGKMVGYLYTFDQFGNLLDDHSQVKVTAIGRDLLYTGHSDQLGRFELEEVPTGTYELHFEKNGFVMLKQFGVQHLGGKPTILPYVDSYEHAYFLYEIPTTSITDLSIINDSLAVYFDFTVPSPPDRIGLKLYFSTQNDFPLNEAEHTYTCWPWKANGYYTSKLYLEDAPFTPGNTVYYKACPYTDNGAIQLPLESYRTVYGVDSYFDYDNNETIYPGLGDESATFNFIFPE